MPGPVKDRGLGLTAGGTLEKVGAVAVAPSRGGPGCPIGRSAEPLWPRREAEDDAEHDGRGGERG